MEGRLRGLCSNLSGVGEEERGFTVRDRRAVKPGPGKVPEPGSTVRDPEIPERGFIVRDRRRRRCARIQPHLMARQGEMRR